MYTLFKYEGETNDKYVKGDIYGIYQDRWQKIHSFTEWKSLSAANKQKIFLACSKQMPSGKVLTEFAPFSMLTYSQEQKNQQFDISFIPKDQRLIMKTLFNLNKVNRLLHIELDTMEVNGIIYVLVTNGLVDEDGFITFFTYKFVDENNLLVNQWLPVLKSDGKNHIWLTDDFGDLTKQKLSSLSVDELDQLFALPEINSLRLGFAFLFKSLDVNPQLKVNNVIIDTDAKGVWHSTQLGVDYTYCYLDDSSMSVTIKKPGKYKINYYS